MNAVSTLEAPEDAASVRSQYVLPGQIFVASVPTRFITVLGSCVAICLYDTDRGVGGLNHFLLPGEPRGSEEREPLRWGVPATDELLRLLIEAGARRAFLQAKVFGGAQISHREVPAALRIGERNVETALEALRRHRIPVMNQSLGGATGRKIIFESHTGMVWAKDLGRHDRQGAPPARGG
jgi:chemotaxis protein CheD